MIIARSENMKSRESYVYIMSNRSKTLYTCVTNNLERRVFQHKQRLVEGFTKKYNLIELVYYEAGDDIRSAIQREKQIKGWLRKRKIDLIELVNPAWDDLSAEWYSTRDPSLRSG